MSMPQVSNVVDFEVAQLMRAEAQLKNFADGSATFAEVSQQISAKLQTTLEIDEILENFFHISQGLVSYDALHFIHAQQRVNVKIGKEQAVYAVNYRLTFAGEYLGDLFLQRSRKIKEHELIRFESLTTSLIFPLRNALKYHAVLQSALRDSLTGVGNRNNMAQTLQRDMDSAKRNGTPMSILMLDLDFFKNINDTYGHASGDQVLIETANCLQRELRSVDAIFRFGGEEFLISLPNADAKQAQMVGERIRAAIAALVIEFNEFKFNISASLGSATMQESENQDSLIQRADYALYNAKRSGRNRLHCAV